MELQTHICRESFSPRESGLESVLCYVTLAKSLNQKLGLLLCELTGVTGPGVVVGRDVRWHGHHPALGRGSVTSLSSFIVIVRPNHIQ